MGTMNCNRRDCENILCDRYSSIHGYICHSCFNELVSMGADRRIAPFMVTSAKEINKEAARARFDVEFPKRER